MNTIINPNTQTQLSTEHKNTKKMQVNVLFWGVLTDVAQTKSIAIEDVSAIGILKEKLLQKYPQLAAYTHHIAVNHEIVHEDEFALKDGDEVALLPPYAGG